MICGTCKNFDLKNSPTRNVGFGLCKADPHPMFRVARTRNPQSLCAINRFEQADAKVIQRREKESCFVL